MNRQFSQLASTGFSIVVSTIVTFQLGQLPAYTVDFVNQRVALGGNDIIDWGTLGSAEPFKQLPNSFSIQSENGLGVSVSVPSFFGSPQPLVFQTLPIPSIDINFPTGQNILFTGFTNVEFPPMTNTALLTVKFDKPVKAAGTQLALVGEQKPDDALTRRGLSQNIVSAFDAENNLLGTFSTTEKDNSPVFLGISSDKANISRLVLRTSEANIPFGINALSFVAIPEPGSTFALLAIACCAGLALKRKSKCKF